MNFFNWSNNKPYQYNNSLQLNSVNILNSYKIIANEFIKSYYLNYDLDLIKLSNMIASDCKITYLEEELIGNTNFLNKLKTLGIYKLTHTQLKYDSQPLSYDSLLITCTGKISANNSTIFNNYIESIVLHKISSQTFIIKNMIFKLIP